MQAELFDRYVYEVGRRLPKGQRADVEAELHSLLMDALQDRLAERGTPLEEATEADQVAILREFDPPNKMADQYRPSHRYVIGPRLYDVYLIVVAVMFGAITLSQLIVLLLAAFGQPVSAGMFASALGDILDTYLNALLAGLGSVTLTFAILERVLPEQVFEEKEDAGWDPRTLPVVEASDRIQPAGLAFEIVLTVVALIVFNFFPQWLGLNFVASINDAERQWYAIPLLSEAFFTLYLPLLNVLWVATIVQKLALLLQGRWGRATRAFDLILSLFGIGIVGRMLSGPAIVSLEAVRPESLRDLLQSFLPPLVRVALVIAMIATVVEAIRKGYRLLRTWTTVGRPFEQIGPRL